MLAWLLGIILLAGDVEGDFQEKSDSKGDSSIQHTDTVVNQLLQVDRILIIGNKITKNRIITRELSLSAGDTISASRLEGVLQWDKNKLYNLRLFNTVTVRGLEMTGNHVDILVEVTERWYIVPVPIFELSDRNFNEWWNNYNHDLDRINYGIRIYKNNFRGRNETVRLTAQFGYIRKFDLQYKIPNLDRSQKHGLTFNFDYGTPRNIPYMTAEHKLVFLESEKVVRTTFGAGVGYSYRKNFFETHQIGLSYRDSHVIDTVLQLNPIYYSGGKTTQRFYTLSYTFISEHRDVVLYPLKGYQFAAYIAKSGLLPDDDVNQFEINISYANHWQLGKGFFLSNFTSALWSGPSTQPYNVFNALGYRNQIVRGFENYVVEGPKFMLNKTTFKKKLFGRTWTVNSMPIEQFRHFPLAMYFKTFADLGYVENYPYYDEKLMNQQFSNRFITGLGGGLDIVTAYDLVFRIEYTFTTQKPEGSFFFNLRKEF